VELPQVVELLRALEALPAPAPVLVLVVVLEARPAREVLDLRRISQGPTGTGRTWPTSRS
jgi:hypothetical protein